MAKILAIDPGDRWIGVSISDPSQLVARPLTTIKLEELESFFAQLFTRENIELVLIGHPITLAGGASDQTRKIVELKTRLETVFPERKFLLWDERKTSQQAAEHQRLTRRRHDPDKKIESHALAATFILNSYLMVKSPTHEED